MKVKVSYNLSYEIDAPQEEIAGAVANIQDSIKILRFSSSSGVKYQGCNMVISSEIPVALVHGTKTNVSSKKEKGN